MREFVNWLIFNRLTLFLLRIIINFAIFRFLFCNEMKAWYICNEKTRNTLFII